jgi:class 3 adenylate cyclase
MPDPRKSKLAAIMFTGIAGYTQRMENDEQKALELLETHNRLVFPLIERFDGRIVKTIGDALLADFSSALSAANCAVNIQKALGNHNQHVEESEKIFIRIGLHIGDIWYSETDILGEGVNIAARLHSFAPPGGICISKEMHDLLVNKITLKTTRLGLKTLKESKKTVDVYCIQTGTEKKGDSGQPGEDDPAVMIKKKVFSTIEDVMDKAVREWNNVPREKKERFLHKFRNAEWFDDWEHETGGMKRHRSKKKERKDELAVGIAATLGFAAALFITDIWLFIFPLVFVGLIPLLSGISKLLKRKQLPEQAIGGKNRPSTGSGKEKEILQTARDLNGRVTVLQIASMTSLSIEDARTTLDSMVKRGYIQLNVGENGILRYEFPEFFKEPDTDDITKQIDDLK